MKMFGAGEFSYGLLFRNMFYFSENNMQKMFLGELKQYFFCFTETSRSGQPTKRSLETA